MEDVVLQDLPGNARHRMACGKGGQLERHEFLAQDFDLIELPITGLVLVGTEDELAARTEMTMDDAQGHR